ncbi:MAG: primosomal protein N', partial [Lachnospirales bacterium]
EKSKKPILTSEQQKAVDEIYHSIDVNDRKPILIHGVTGSGKTEIYLRAIEKVLALGKQAIVLVPEISLTQQTVERFTSRFGNLVSVTHSKLSDGERFDQWTRAKRGEISVMIGPRSAIFTPFENLGIIVIDEEHETTYKADQQQPKFDTREVAIELSNLYNCQVILGSATPSVVSYYKAKNSEYRLIELKNRVNNTYPNIQIVDMREELVKGNKTIFSTDLKDAIEYNLLNKQQTILFLNRRGFANFISCRKCGYVMTCKNCNVNYTYHKNYNNLLCHYCGMSVPKPQICPQCGSEHIRQFGIGTEKVEEEIHKLFPDAKTLRMDLDTTRNKNAHNILIDKFRNGEADILIGTQMIAKGLDFPNVTVVGIIAADMSLNINDYHSCETTYQLVTQVCGRAGRADKGGKAFVQTYNPDHYSLVCARDNDYIKFYSEEIKYRESLDYPPFGNIFVVLFTGENLNEIRQYLGELSYIMTRYNKNNQFSHMGPIPAVISKIKNNHRWQIIVKAKDEEKIKNYVLFCLNKLKLQRNLDKINIGLYLNPNYSF